MAVTPWRVSVSNINRWSLVGSVAVQKMNISFPFPVFQGLVVMYECKYFRIILQLFRNIPDAFLRFSVTGYNRPDHSRTQFVTQRCVTDFNSVVLA